MDWKEGNCLKTLNWMDILKTSSDNEYDSDETCCDINDDVVIGYETKSVDCNKESAQERGNHDNKTYRPSSAGEPPQTVIQNIPGDVKCVEQEQSKSNDNVGKEKEMNQQEKTILNENKVSKLVYSQEEINDKDIVVNGSTLSEYESTQKVKRRPGRPSKTPKVLTSKKSLPKRNCRSRYVNNSERSKEKVESESLSDTEDFEFTKCGTLEFRRKLELEKGLEFEYTPRMTKFYNKPKQENSTKKTSKRGRKRRTVNNNSNGLKDLRGIDSELKVIEDKVERWIAGVDGNAPTRQQAFDMLAESQNFIKLLKEHQRSQSSMYPIKNDSRSIKLLLKRAKIVSVLIDKTIAEADRLMNLEESTDFDPETESQQDIQINEKTLEDCDLRPILKHMVDSEENSEYHNKRVSFNDNIEYHYFPTDDCCIDITNDASQEHTSNRKWGNVLDHNKEKARTFLSGLNRVTREEITSNVKEREIGENVTKINIGANKLTLGKEVFNSEPGKNYAPITDNKIIKNNDFEKNFEKTSINTKDQCQSKDEEYFINLDNSVSSERYGDKKDKLPPESENGICRKLVQDNNCNSEDLLRNNQTEDHLSVTQQILTDNNDAMLSEASTGDENSFGFSKIEKLSDNLAWTKITIMSIKSITLRDNNEIMDASFCADDFKW